MNTATTPLDMPGSAHRPQKPVLLTSGLGHDMRNAVMPLLLHLDMLDLISASKKPVPGLDLAQVVENLQRLANGLLLRTTDQHSPPSPTRLHLHSWWEDIGDLIRNTLPRACALQVKLAPDLPLVLAEPAVLAQVMLHLMVNVRLALKPGSECGVTIAAARTGRGLSLTVHDGSASTVTTGSHTTTQLTASWGMALSRTLLQRSGGEIAGHSIIGEGTYVTIRLPLAPPIPCDASPSAATAGSSTHTASRSQPGPRAARTTGGAVAREKLSVLCIDDNAALTAALALRLGMDARFTLLPPLHSLDDSLARIAALKPSIVLLDLNLPGTERPLDVIRALRDGGSTTKLIVLTGNPSVAAVSATRAAGAHGFIAKGVSPDRLISAILRAGDRNGDGEFVLELDY